jgi:hypothetical protein
MPRHTATIEIDATPARIWSLLASVESAQQQDGLRVEFDEPPPIKTGLAARNIDTETGEVVARITYIRVEPERELAIESRERRATRTSRTRLDPIGPGRTLVRTDLHYRVRGLLGFLAGPMTSAAIRHDLLADLAYLKDAAEE